jgi:hypothetical protein
MFVDHICFMYRLFRNKATKASIRTLGAAVLLLLYLISGQPQEVFHQFVHEHEEITHSAEQEQDACHRSIYHEQNDGCGHKAHFTTSEKCALCDHYIKTDHLYSTNANHTSTVIYSTDRAFIATFSASDPIRVLPSRGPPAI